MNELAQIGLFVYNRINHAERTVNALRNNELARQSNLTVFSDAPRTEKDKPKVAAVREFIKNIDGFATIEVVLRDHNLGLARSLIRGIDYLTNRYGAAIIVEDDNLTSPYFLRLMNESLKLYENDTEVCSICGYSYPAMNELPETFFIRGADSWGWATWRRGWEVFKKDGSWLLNALKTNGLSYEFDYDGAYPFSKMLEDQIAGRNDSWAIRWMASAFLAGKLTLYPGRSLVQNIGFDGSGVHCVLDLKKSYDVVLSDKPIDVKKIPLKENESARKELGRYFRRIADHG